MSAWAASFHWTGEGFPRTARYALEFRSQDEAREFSEAVLEGRELRNGTRPARWQIRCQDGERRRLGTADSAYTMELVDRRRSAA